MEMLVTQGKVRYVGSSNFAGWHLASAQAAADRRNFLGLVSEQCNYNLLTRHVELEVLPAAAALRHRHPAVLAAALRRCSPARCASSARAPRGRSVLHARGRASSRTGPRSSSTRSSAPSSARNRPRSRSPGCWPSPAVTAPVIGPRSVDQLDLPLGALDHRAVRRRRWPAGRAVPADRQGRPRPGGVGLVVATPAHGRSGEVGAKVLER